MWLNSKTVMTTCLLLSSMCLNAQNLDPAKVCSPVLTRAVTERYLESNRSFQKKILSQLCSEQQLTAEKARSQGLEINAVVDGVPLGALWSDDASERQDARSKLCTKDFSDVSDVTHIKLMERVPVPDLMANYNRCVELTTASATPMTCSLSDGDPEFSTLHITYYPKMAVAAPLVTTSTVNGGFVVGGQAETGYQTAVKLWKLQAGGSRPALPTTDVLLPANTEIKTGSTFLTLRRAAGKPLRAVMNNTLNIPCQAESAASDDVAINVVMTPYGRMSAIEQAVKQLRAADGCSADGSVTHERQYCADERGTLENVGVNILSAGSPKNASYIEKVERVGNCAKVYFHLRGAGLDVLRMCKGSAWLDADITLSQRVPVGDVIPFVPHQTTMTVPTFDAGCSMPLTFGGQLPAGAILTAWKWKAEIALIEREPDQHGMESLHRNTYQLSDANASNGKFSGKWMIDVPTAPTLVIARDGDHCSRESVSPPGEGLTPTVLEHMRTRSLQVTNPGDPNMAIMPDVLTRPGNVEAIQRVREMPQQDRAGESSRNR